MDEAITSSVRSALEQTYGVFISSDTRVNITENETDQSMEVIDEMATLTSGNIVAYEIISSSILDNGEAAATTRCTIALEPMKSFITSKGENATFAGGMFGRTMKLRELNITAEERAMQDLTDQTRMMLSKSVDFEVSPGEPAQKGSDWTLPISVKSSWNQNFPIWQAHVFKTMEGIAMSKDEIQDYQSNNQDIFSISVSEGSAIGRPKYNQMHFRNYQSIAHVLDMMHVIGQALLNYTIDADVFTIEGTDCWDMVIEGEANYISGFLGVPVVTSKKCTEWAFSAQIVDPKRSDDLAKYSLLNQQFYTGNGMTQWGGPPTERLPAGSLALMGTTEFLTGQGQDRFTRHENHSLTSIVRLGCDPTEPAYGGTNNDNTVWPLFFWNIGELSRNASAEYDFQLGVQILPVLPMTSLEKIKEIAVQSTNLLKLR